MGQPKILQIEAQARSLIKPWVPGPAWRVKNPDRGGLIPSEYSGVGDSEAGGRTRFSALRGPQGHRDRGKPTNQLSLGTRSENGTQMRRRLKSRKNHEGQQKNSERKLRPRSWKRAVGPAAGLSGRRPYRTTSSNRFYRSN